MAINPAAQFPGKIAPPDADYPYGGARNVSTPGDGTGTPWDEALINDLFGFQQALLDLAGTAPTGTPETAQSSQYLDAMIALFAGGGGSVNAEDTVATMVSNAGLGLGDIVRIAEYAAGYDTGVMWGVVVAGGTGTADGGSYIDIAGGLQFQQILGPVVHSYQFGASPGASAANNTAAINLALITGAAVVTVPRGDINVSSTIVVNANQTLVGQAGTDSAIVQSAVNTPTVLVSSVSGEARQVIKDITLEVNHVASNDVTQIALDLPGSSEFLVSGCHIDNPTAAVADDGGGIAIRVDMGVVAGANGGRVEGNTIQGFTEAVSSIGPVQGLQVTRNSTRCKIGCRIERGATMPGTTAVFGLRITGNDFYGAPTGGGLFASVVIGQGDGALGFNNAEMTSITGNAMHHPSMGVVVFEGCKQVDVSGNLWGFASNLLTDLNAAGDAFYGLDLVSGALQVAGKALLFTPQGALNTAFNGANGVYMGGEYTTTGAPATNGSLSVTHRAHELITGPTATNVTVGGGGTTPGQRLTLIANDAGFTVTLSTTGVDFDGGVAPVMGGGSGEVALLEFIRVGSRWVEVSRNTRP